MINASFWAARSTFGAAVNEQRYFLLFVGGAALWSGAGVTKMLVGKGATAMTAAELKEKKEK